MISRNARFAIVALLLAGTGLFLKALDRSPSVLPKSLGAGEFLQRTYRDPASSGAYVDLYVRYIPNQHALFRHLPQNCLEGSGWTPVESGTTMLALPGDAPFSASRYLIAKGDVS